MANTGTQRHGGWDLVHTSGIVNLPKNRAKIPKDFSRTGKESDPALCDQMDVCASLNFHNKQRLLSYILLAGMCNWDRVFCVNRNCSFRDYLHAVPATKG